MTHPSWLRALCGLLAVVVVILGDPLGAEAVTVQPFTAVGSTGVPDAATEANLRLDGPLAEVRTLAVPPARVVELRYNVVAVAGLFTSLDGVKMTIRYRDNGAGANVFVRLMEINSINGAVDKRMAFNSDAYPADPNYQRRSIVQCEFGNFFNFMDKAYWLIVRLTRSSNEGLAGIASVRVESASLADCTL